VRGCCYASGDRLVEVRRSAEDRHRQRGRVGEGSRRLPRATAALDAVVEHQMSFNLLGRGRRRRQTGVVG
jgi:hypothetical protein